MTSEQIFIRAFPATLEQSGPHRLTGRFAPYGVVADVLDRLPDGNVDIYREGFRRGVFGTQATSREPGVPRRIEFVHTHEGGLGYLGPVVALRDEPDGLYGDVAVLRSKAGDVEDLLAAGVQELSVEFRLARHGHTEVDADGVRWRVKGHLDRVALEPQGSYTGAMVTAFRAEMDELAKEEATRQAAEAAERAAADAGAQAEREQAEAEQMRARQRAELDDWLAAEQARQDELSARYLGG